MTDIDLAALRAAAEGATPGPWEQVTDNHGREELDHSVWSALGECYVVERLAGPDAAHVTAANPAVVLALLDELEALRAVVQSPHDPTPQQWDAYASSVRDMPDPYRDEAAIRRALEAPPATPYIPPSLKRTLARNHEEQP